MEYNVYYVSQKGEGRMDMYQCVVCGKEMPEYEPVYCCDGRECGCMGKPIEPPICNQECWNKLMGKQD